MSEREPAPSTDDQPGVPGFRRWSGVYWFVVVFFILTVGGLAVFSRFYG